MDGTLPTDGTTNTLLGSENLNCQSECLSIKANLKFPRCCPCLTRTCRPKINDTPACSFDNGYYQELIGLGGDPRRAPNWSQRQVRSGNWQWVGFPGGRQITMLNADIGKVLVQIISVVVATSLYDMQVSTNTQV